MRVAPAELVHDALRQRQSYRRALEPPITSEWAIGVFMKRAPRDCDRPCFRNGIPESSNTYDVVDLYKVDLKSLMTATIGSSEGAYSPS
jgi:hypothetical protein